MRSIILLVLIVHWIKADKYSENGTFCAIFRKDVEPEGNCSKQWNRFKAISQPKTDSMVRLLI